MSESSERLMYLIQSRGVSYAELAELSGVPKSALHRYANGNTDKIPADRAERIGRALGATGAWILGLSGDEAPTTPLLATPTTPPIVLSVPASKSARDKVRLNGVVRISEEAELALLELCGKTGLSMRNVASALIVQAAQVCEIRNE